MHIRVAYQRGATLKELADRFGDTRSYRQRIGPTPFQPRR